LSLGGVGTSYKATRPEIQIIKCSSFIGRINAAKGQKSTVVFILFIICISGVSAL
jgi:hypothetical protein